QPDLGEYLQVALRDGVARQLDRIERSVQAGHPPSKPRIALEQPPPQQYPPERFDRMKQLRAVAELALQVVEHVLATDRRACLLRGPRRKRAPSGTRVRAPRPSPPPSANNNR